jgi:hypothetical protein
VAAVTLDAAVLEKLPHVRKQLEALSHDDLAREPGADGSYLLSALSTEKLTHLVNTMFDPKEFYSPYGLRSVSRVHEKQPAVCKIGEKTFELRYQPGESADKVFGGNSNWRGPIWAPINQLVIEALYTYHAYFGETLTIKGEKPVHLEKAALQLVDGLTGLFERDQKGCRPFFSEHSYFENDPHWRDSIWFYEHFHAETGAGLGASHQNGWTALIAKLIQDQGRALPIPDP